MLTPSERNAIVVNGSLIVTRLLQSNKHYDNVIDLDDMLVIPEMTNNIDLYAAAGEILAICVKENYSVTINNICADATAKALLQYMENIHAAATEEKDIDLVKSAAALAILILQKKINRAGFHPALS